MPHSQPTALQQTVCKFHLDPQYHIFHWGSTILGDSTLWDGPHVGPMNLAFKVTTGPQQGISLAEGKDQWLQQAWYNALSISHSHLSSKNSQKATHSSHLKVRYGCCLWFKSLNKILDSSLPWYFLYNVIFDCDIVRVSSYTPRFSFNKVERGVYWFHLALLSICSSVRPSVCPSVLSVRLWTE